MVVYCYGYWAVYLRNQKFDIIFGCKDIIISHEAKWTRTLICNNNAFYNDNSCVFFVYFYTKIYILEEWSSFHKLKQEKKKEKACNMYNSIQPNVWV